MKSPLIRKIIFDTALIFVVLLFIFTFFEPNLCYDSVSHGIKLSVGFLVPTLFLSTTFTSLIYSLISKNGIFPEKYSILLLGIIGGYPTCAYLTNEAYKNGNITLRDARALTYSVTCAGPAFIISGIGIKFLGSAKIGLLMYISVIIPQLILFLLLKDKNGTVTKNKSGGIPDMLCSSVSGAALSSLYLTGYVAFFSALCTMLSYVLGDKYQFIIRFLEITYAVENLTVCKPIFFIYRIVFLLALGDFCVHLQIKQNLKTVSYSYSKYLLSRVLCAALSTGIFFGLIYIFPVNLSVINLSISPIYSNIPASIFLILLSVYTVAVKIKTNTEK